MSELRPGNRIKINPEVVILPVGQSYELTGTVTKVEGLRADIRWDDGTCDDWYVGDLMSDPIHYTKGDCRKTACRKVLQETSLSSDEVSEATCDDCKDILRRNNNDLPEGMFS